MVRESLVQRYKRWLEREGGRKNERKVEREGRERDKERERETYRQTNRQTDRRTEGELSIEIVKRRKKGWGWKEKGINKRYKVWKEC